MSNGEKIIQANGVDLCVETFGDTAGPAILLIHGASASMLWWEEELCERIAASGRYVIRFDNRDTGRSVSYPPGGPEYSLRDIVEFIVGLMRVYSGGSPHYDEDAMRALASRDVARTSNTASCLTNHFVIDFGDPAAHRLGEIGAPTLVVHGELDPVFPLPHGKALQSEIPDSELLIMEKTGHELPPPVWDVFVAALVRHTGG
jgi:pimeloyl-ACP methyl ester carboxylesterase